MAVNVTVLVYNKCQQPNGTRALMKVPKPRILHSSAYHICRPSQTVHSNSVGPFPKTVARPEADRPTETSHLRHCDVFNLLSSLSPTISTAAARQ
jgi:hypothetical protein